MELSVKIEVGVFNSFVFNSFHALIVDRGSSWMLCQINSSEPSLVSYAKSTKSSHKASGNPEHNFLNKTLFLIAKIHILRQSIMLYLCSSIVILAFERVGFWGFFAIVNTF